MRYLPTIFFTLLFASVFIADQRTINFDAEVDFSRIKTFAIGEMKNKSTLPELNNPLLLQGVADAIRAQLTAKGLRETSDSPDVLMNCHIDDIYYDGPEGNPQRGVGPSGRRPIQGILVVDMMQRDSNMLIWQGSYRDDEDNGSKVARNLPLNVGKVLTQYPPKKRKP
jgi:Domain of unknown function (DUF4136)